jgi:hypothetical protein
MTRCRVIYRACWIFTLKWDSRRWGFKYNIKVWINDKVIDLDVLNANKSTMQGTIIEIVFMSILAAF